MQAGAGTVTARVFVNYKGSDTIEKVPLCHVAHALLRTASEHCCPSSERSRTVGGDKVGWTIGFSMRFLTHCAGRADGVGAAAVRCQPGLDCAAVADGQRADAGAQPREVRFTAH